MSNPSRAWLAVENGLVLEGRAVGAAGERGGDLVFNTAMSGYHEILTDPSYSGQVVVMTYTQIGNYGVPDEDDESARGWPEAFVMKEMSSVASNFRSNHSLTDWLRKRGIVAIDGVDTRRLTKLIRTEGSLRCVVSTTDGDHQSLIAKARATRATDGRDLASEVSCRQPYAWDASYDASYPTGLARWDGRRLRCVAYDFGAKRNILRSLVYTGFDVTVVPAWTKADDVLAMKPDCVFLSNGPGDPAAVRCAIDSVSNLLGKTPIFGICLGHQILSIVFGAKTHKMPFGHHGANHPVRDMITGRIEITSQNHSFAVEQKSMPADIELTHLNLNDHSVEGMRHKKLPVFSVQYHPEAAPGPLDSCHLFERFRQMVIGKGHPAPAATTR
ncbi:MAG: glutamine-hydrolyzing carbamoyl-phosphate synthase small subunit [Planctomycetes bacterium]|nr:glutamine-hydrolyzing carbamoyl-phosphate synthase small subunit [Planctomycetota bacterium]